MPRQGPFDVTLSVPAEDVEVELRGFTAVPGRGSSSTHGGCAGATSSCVGLRDGGAKSAS